MKSKKIKKEAGIGLRSDHHLEVVANVPPVSWWEIHTENFFAAGGRQLDFLEKIASLYPLSFHGVGLSLGSADGIRESHLKQVKALVDRFNPCFVSEHISWSSLADEVINDLLPIPYNKESMLVISDNIKKFQDYLGRQVLVENPSSYAAFKSSDLLESEFILAVIEKTGCGLLLDINNVYVSAQNLGFSAKSYIDSLAVIDDKIQEIHLAGHSVLENKYKKRFLVDTHDDYVCQDVWNLYEYTLSKIGNKPTLIEWDSDVPELKELMLEAKRAQRIMDGLNRVSCGDKITKYTESIS